MGLKEIRRMTIATDMDNRVVVHYNKWWRVFGGFIFVTGVVLLYVLVADIREDILAGDIGAIIFPLWIFMPFFLFGGSHLLGYTCQFIFNHTLGNITIKSGIGPIIYRSRTFSKKEVLTCWVEDLGGEMGSRWHVSLEISGRKKDLKIIVDNEKRADYIVDRIRAFYEIKNFIRRGTTLDAASEKCANHPDMDAGVICIHCGQHICHECAVFRAEDEEIYCMSCIDKLFPHV